MKKDKILVTGANGQIGTVLSEELRHIYGNDRVLSTDIRSPENIDFPFEVLDILNRDGLQKLVRQFEVTEIYHLAAILSAKGEQNPKLAWDVNMSGWFNVLDIAREHQLKVFFPSSIAVFGSQTPRFNTPQFTVQEPESVYGISKVAGESWGQYYYQKFDVDVRSVRYPGIISHQSMPGGGTTDYAVEIYHSAVKGEDYTCFLKKNARLPMVYMSDAIRGTIEIMQAPADAIKIRTSYNLAGMNFTPEEIYSEIKRFYPNFNIKYEPDFREKIAESWPATLDDHHARHDWGWYPKYDLSSMTKDMINHLKEYYQIAGQSA